MTDVNPQYFKLSLK